MQETHKEKVSVETRGIKSTLKFNGDIELRTFEFWEMCVELYDKLTYCNDVTINIHNPSEGDDVVRFSKEIGNV